MAVNPARKRTHQTELVKLQRFLFELDTVKPSSGPDDLWESAVPLVEERGQSGV